MSRLKSTILAVAVTLSITACSGASDESDSASPPPPSTSPTAVATAASSVPDVAGLSGADAAARLADAGMTAKFVAMSGGDISAVDAAERTVVETYPEAGADVHSSRAVSVFVGSAPQQTSEPTTSAPAPTTPPDVATDAGLCAADAELSNLELNDAIAPLLGYPSSRDDRTVEQDDAIRAYKDAAFARACPERTS